MWQEHGVNEAVGAATRLNTPLYYYYSCISAAWMFVNHLLALYEPLTSSTGH